MSDSFLNFTDAGSGPAVVLIHGFCESIEVWRELSILLSGHARVICIDIPGFGGSPLRGENASIEFYADEIFNFISTLKLDKFVLAGHSLGGYIALAMADKYSDFLSGLILFHSSAFPDSEEKKLDRNKTIDFIQLHGSGAFSKALIPSLFTAENLKIHAARVTELLDIASETKPESIIAAAEAMRDRSDKTHVLKDTKKPVLFIIGKEDKAIPLEVSLKQCHLPGESVAYFLSGVAHMGMIEKTSETFGICKDFIDLCQTKH